MSSSSNSEHSEIGPQQDSTTSTEDINSEHEITEQRQNNKKGCKKRKHMKKVVSDSEDSSASEGTEQVIRASKKRRKKSSDHNELKRKEHISSGDETEEKSPIRRNDSTASISSGAETEERESAVKGNRTLYCKAEECDFSNDSTSQDEPGKKREENGSKKQVITESEENSPSHPHRPLSRCVPNEKSGSNHKLNTVQHSSDGSDDTSDSDEKMKSFYQRKSQSDRNSSSKSLTPPNVVDKKSKRMSDWKKVKNKTQKDTGNAEKINPKIEKLKKYLRVAGLRVRSYQKLWEDCRTNKAKIEKLLQMLSDAGLKGKPTLQKCKRLQAKRERKQEVASLDVGNIIVASEKGRPKRSTPSLYLSRRVTDTGKNSSKGKGDNIFSRIKNIDIEESE